ncbi:MAG: hypothetical protein GY846_22610 [Deltaproteobacteria bacterium]|nr:hypothetical protein [Deltaproteobacteria bacterium]
MKIRKSTFNWLVWTLAFFLITAGLAQGAEACKGKCCQGPQEPAGHDLGEVELSLNPKTPLDAFLPLCHLPGPVGDHRAAASEGEPCEDGGAPPCCHIGKAGASVQALASQGHFWGPERLVHAGLVTCIQPDAFLNENQRHLAVDGGSLHPRAAPVPLYLKNTSFIC